MHADKLLRLADFLETEVKDEWFNLKIFADEGFDIKTCGTTACAWGWASQVPEWQSVLTLKKSFSYHGLAVIYNEKYNFEAAQEFFNLNHQQCNFLFDPMYYSYTSKEYVIDRLRKFVASGGSVDCDPDNTDEYFEDDDDDDLYEEFDDEDDYDDDYEGDEYDDDFIIEKEDDDEEDY
jgi:hypothetical protein